MTPERLLTFAFALALGLGVISTVYSEVVQPAFASVRAATGAQ